MLSNSAQPLYAERALVVGSNFDSRIENGEWPHSTSVLTLFPVFQRRSRTPFRWVRSWLKLIVSYWSRFGWRCRVKPPSLLVFFSSLKPTTHIGFVQLYQCVHNEVQQWTIACGQPSSEDRGRSPFAQNSRSSVGGGGDQGLFLTLFYTIAAAEKSFLKGCILQWEMRPVTGSSIKSVLVLMNTSTSTL